MGKSSTGLLAGLLLAIAIIVGGWTGLLVAVVLGLVGLVVGAQLSGDVDVPTLFRGRG